MSWLVCTSLSWRYSLCLFLHSFVGHVDVHLASIESVVQSRCRPCKGFDLASISLLATVHSLQPHRAFRRRSQPHCRCRASSAPRVSGEMPLTRRVRHRRESIECTSDSCSGQRKGTAMDTCHVLGCIQVQEEHSPTSPLNATTAQVKHLVATHCLHQ